MHFQLFAPSPLPPPSPSPFPRYSICFIISDSVKGKIFQFYKWVRFYQNTILQSKELSPLPMSISGLTASLHKYQISAVQWMLGREGAQGWANKDKNDNIHPLWQPINNTRGDTLYYNRYTGK